MIIEKRGKYCPLIRDRCITDCCSWWTEHREITSDGIQTEELCAIVEMSRGAEIAIDMTDE